MRICKSWGIWEHFAFLVMLPVCFWVFKILFDFFEILIDIYYVDTDYIVWFVVWFMVWLMVWFLITLAVGIVFSVFCRREKNWVRANRELKSRPVMASIFAGIFIISCTMLSYCEFTFPLVPKFPSYVPWLMIILTLICIAGVSKYFKYLSEKKELCISRLLRSGFYLLFVGQCAAFLTLSYRLLDSVWWTIGVMGIFAVVLIISWVMGIKKGYLRVSIALQLYILFILVLAFALIFQSNSMGIVGKDGQIFIGIKGFTQNPIKQKNVSMADGLDIYLYFSTVTFTTLGYGDFTPTKRSRLIAAFEAVLGYMYLSLLLGLILLQLAEYHTKNKKTTKSLSTQIEKMNKKLDELLKLMNN